MGKRIHRHTTERLKHTTMFGYDIGPTHQPLTTILEHLEPEMTLSVAQDLATTTVEETIFHLDMHTVYGHTPDTPTFDPTRPLDSIWNSDTINKTTTLKAAVTVEGNHAITYESAATYGASHAHDTLARAYPHVMRCVDTTREHHEFTPPAQASDLPLPDTIITSLEKRAQTLLLPGLTETARHVFGKATFGTCMHIADTVCAWAFTTGHEAAQTITTHMTTLTPTDLAGEFTGTSTTLTPHTVRETAHQLTTDWMRAHA